MKSILLTLAILCGCCSSSRAQYAAAIDSIPFTLGADSRLFLTCKVNQSEPLRFLFDTGATDMVANVNSPRMQGLFRFDGEVKNLGTTGSGSVKRSSGNTFRAGRQRVKKMSFIGIPYPPDMFDGVLGLAWMRRYCIVVDYDRQQLYLFPPGGYRPGEGWAKMPVAWRLGVPVIQTRVVLSDSIYTVNTEVDTGSDRVLDLGTPFVKRHALLGTRTPFAVSRVTSSDGGSGELLNVWFDQVGFGALSVDSVPGAFSTLTTGMLASDEVDAMAGNNLLQRFNLVLDFSNDVVYLHPNGRMKRKYYDFLP